MHACNIQLLLASPVREQVPELFEYLRPLRKQYHLFWLLLLFIPFSIKRVNRPSRGFQGDVAFDDHQCRWFDTILDETTLWKLSNAYVNWVIRFHVKHVIMHVVVKCN